MPEEGNGERTANDTPIAEQAGAAVEQQVAAVETGAQNAIEEAEARAREAQQTAEQLAEASLHSEYARRIAAQDERLEQWRQEQKTTRLQVSELATNYGSLQTKFGQMEGLLAGIAAAAAPQSTPPNNPAPPPTSAPVQDPPPNNQSAEEGRREAENQPRKRVRRFL